MIVGSSCSNRRVLGGLLIVHFCKGASTESCVKGWRPLWVQKVFSERD